MSESEICGTVFERGLALTEAQAAFVVAYMASHRALEAYRAAFDVPDAVSDAVVWHEASAVLGNQDVIFRVMELQEAAAADDGAKAIGASAASAASAGHGVSDADIRALTCELEKARVKAMGDEKGANTAVSATMGKAKLLGLMTDGRTPATRGEASSVTVAIIDFAKMSHDPDMPSQ
ncbi:MAG: hypothetical protein ACSHYC_05040 [Alphaproteobacteria bacterium]